MSYDILVVEDDADLRQVLSVVLTEEGYDVRATASSQEALKLADEQTPDLILMDLVLPLDTGISLAEHLKSSSCRRVPIIAMSAWNPAIEWARAQEYFEAWLPKPFSLQTLLHFVALTEDRETEG